MLVDGSDPVVLLGANGVGKSRFAATMAGAHGYIFVPADRQTSLPATMNEAFGPSLEEFRANNQAGISGQRPRVAADVSALFQALKREEEELGSNYLRDSEANPALERPVSRLRHIERLWQIIFPDREFSFRTRSPKMRWIHPSRDDAEYPASEMSDGEKSALYLTARLIYAPPGVVVIDEPEIHLHSILARRFWDEVEASRPDCRFVYATHDLPFALSRRSARIAIVRSPTDAILIPKDSPVPASLFQEIYGAASLSVVAERIVFCEGTDDGSLDRPFFEAWFDAGNTAVVPAGSCGAVREAVRVFGTSGAISNANAIGILERDYWPDDWLAARSHENLFVLDVHELESLFCLEEVARAVAEHLAHDNYAARWSQLQGEARRALQREAHIVERAKRRVDIALESLANAARNHPDRNQARSNFASAIDLARKVPDAGALFDEEAIAVDAAADGSWDDILRVFDGKKLIGKVAQSLDLTKEAYIRLIIKSLSKRGAGTPLGLRLEEILAQRLPARSTRT